MLTAAGRPGQRRVLVALALAVLAVHVLLLEAIDLGSAPAQPSRAAALQVREIAAPPVVAVAEAPAAPAPPPTAARARRAPDRPAAPAPDPDAPRVEPATALEPPFAAVAASAPEAPVDRPAPAPVPAAAAARTDAAAAPLSEVNEIAAPDAPLPTYPTRLPPSATLRYDLQRGRIGGSGELRWGVDGERYELRLEGAVVGIPVLTQVSRGVLGAVGIAPQRFTDQRARRAMQAANFQPEAGKVTFSGPSHEVALHDGAQDRLSWMIQLAGIAAADPARREAGAKTALQVVGARGDSGVWVFRCAGTETVETRAGPVETIRYGREPRGPYDTGVAIWLDPARHFLPLRATMRNGADGEVLELRLRDADVGG